MYLKNISIYRLIAKAWIGLFIAHTAAPFSCAAEGPRGFQVKPDQAGKYWLVDPEGKRFVSIGINTVVPEPWRPRPGTDYYRPVPALFGGDFAAWKKDVLSLLERHGFNTLGAWSDGRLFDGSLYGTVCLYVTGHAEDRCLDGLRPGFEGRVRENIRLMLADYPYMDNVFGVFLDNEMPWYGHAPWGDIPNHTLLEQALSLPANDPARSAAINFLKQRYASIQAFSEAWGRALARWEDLSFDYARSCLNPNTQKDRSDFIGHAAEAFYAPAARIARELLPGKLILGTRFAEYAPEPVIRACGRHCDIISFNHYTRAPRADAEMLAKYWIWGGHTPLMITEYSWRAEENTSGNPNTAGAGAVVKTQAERAENYARYVEDLLTWPMVVGAHWFEFSDQSPQGRFDGENSNYGIVDIHHRPYKELLAAMQQIHRRIVPLRSESPRKAPDALPAPKAVVFEPGQYPERPASVDLLTAAPTRDPEVYHAPDAGIGMGRIDDVLVIGFDTGTDWGCGVLFFGPKAFRNESGPYFSTNLGGYSAIELDAEIGDSIVFDLFLDEAGTDAPNAERYDRSGGDDGESFVIPMIRGKAQRHVYRFELGTLQPRTNWGNQRGARRVDITSMKGISLFFHGGQGKDRIKVYSLKLVR